MDDVIFFLAVAGAAFSLTVLHVGEPYRLLLKSVEKLFRGDDRPIDEQDGTLSRFSECPMCASFWIGFFSKVDWEVQAFSWDPFLYAFGSVSVTFMIYAIVKMGFKDA